MMVSFVLSFFPRDVLDEILNLIESVSEDFPSYSCIIALYPGGSLPHLFAPVGYYQSNKLKDVEGQQNMTPKNKYAHRRCRKRKQFDFDRTRECQMSLISNKTSNCIGDNRNVFRKTFRF